MGHPGLNTAFLLGSGASIGAGFPSTAELTETVLSGKGYARHTDETYFKGARRCVDKGTSDAYVPHISDFLKWLHCHVSSYYTGTLGRDINYEDLYYLVGQIHDEVVGDLDNALVSISGAQINEQLCRCGMRVASSVGNGRSSLPIQDMTREILGYIADVVHSELSDRETCASYLTFLRDAQAASDSGNVSIFTLNHDLLVDRFLRDHGVEVIDGFGAPVNSLRYWNQEAFSNDRCGCTLLKLHGSIVWYRFRTENGGRNDERIGCCLDISDIEHTKDPDGRPQRPLEGRPLILIGTFNKMLAYTGGIFADLFCEFRRRLVKTDALVICGYGFGDKGINNQLVHWVSGAKDRRMLVVHPEPQRLRNGARGAIQNNWDAWVRGGSPQASVLRSREINLG